MDSVVDGSHYNMFKIKFTRVVIGCQIHFQNIAN